MVDTPHPDDDSVMTQAEEVVAWKNAIRQGELVLTIIAFITLIGYLQSVGKFPKNPIGYVVGRLSHH